jgi:predicted MFS family arabinose efflux permease
MLRFLLPVNLLLLSESVIAYTFPILVDSTLGNATSVGILLSLSSVIGLICDMLFPILLSRLNWRQMLSLTIITSFACAGLMYAGTQTGNAWYFLAMAFLWGIFYEGAAFSQRLFVATDTGSIGISRSWGMIHTIWQGVSIVGAILASLLLDQPLIMFVVVTGSLQLLAICSLLIRRPRRKRAGATEKPKRVHWKYKDLDPAKSNLGHRWLTIGFRAWPAFLMAFIIGCNAATFWALGPLLGVAEAGGESLDWLILGGYYLGMIVGTSLVTVINQKNHKKFTAQVALLLGGVIMAVGMLLTSELLLTALIIFAATCFTAFALPLSDAVVTDLMQRAPFSEDDISGMTSTMSSLAVILVSPVVGAVADQYDYRSVFIAMSAGVAIVAAFLLFATPRKLKFPS